MKTTFKLKVLTPMFMGGADPEGEPELRSASIRGAMRFWCYSRRDFSSENFEGRLSYGEF